MTAVAVKRRRAAKAKPGPVCGVCSHRDREAIDRALVSGESAPKIAARYRKLTDDTVRRHAEAHLPQRLVKAAEGREAETATRIMEQLEHCISRVTLLQDACDRWLRDPDDPSRYEIGPRVEDLMVTYVERGDDGKPTRQKARLSELLARVAGVAPEICLVETTHADPRKLILAAAQRLDGHRELLARLLGELKDAPTFNIIVSPRWVTLRTVILQALDPHPAAKVAVAAAIEAHAGD